MNIKDESLILCITNVDLIKRNDDVIYLLSLYNVIVCTFSVAIHRFFYISLMLPILFQPKIPRYCFFINFIYF